MDDDGIRKKQASSNLRENQQHHAFRKQFRGGISGSHDVTNYETGLQHHKKLENLYISTHAAKRFQRDIVRGVEGYILTGSRQVEIGTKLSEDSQKYGTENTCTTVGSLSRVALHHSKACAQVEIERMDLLTTLRSQVAGPLRAFVKGSSLEEARHLAQRYDRVRQDAEVQAREVSRGLAKVWEINVGSNDIMKLEAAELKLSELNMNMAILRKEAVAAMADVEVQQQRATLHRLTSLVEAERTYHQRVLQILDQLEEKMLSERQDIESYPVAHADNSSPSSPAYRGSDAQFSSQTYDWSTDGMDYFLVEVSGHGWAEGECKGIAGWFPFEYVERRENVPASKVLMMAF